MPAKHRLSKEGDKIVISSARNLVKKKLRIKETVCTIIADKPEALKVAEETIAYHRKQLEIHIETHADFLYALEPLEMADGPDVVQLMAWASAKAGVGPMASVAGALADLAVGAMLARGAKTAIVENGGEVAAVSESPVDVGLWAGDSPLSGRLGFRVEKFPAGIATSSGVYGHALSFGEAEAATIFAKNASLADAAATAVCNAVRGNSPDQAIRKGIEKAWSIEGVKGVLIIYKGRVALAGEVPKLISLGKESERSRQQK